MRGVGIIEMDATQDVPVALIIDLSEPSDLFPLEPKERLIAGLRLPMMGLRPFEAAAPIKAELALSQAIAL